MKELWKHQIGALDWIAAHPSASYIDGWMGTGKSRIVVEHVNRTRPQRTLILCPSKVIPGWAKQFRDYGSGEQLVLALDDGTTTQRAQDIEDAEAKVKHGAARGTVAVLNYEAIIRPRLAARLLRQPWDVLVFDEAHKLKSPGGAISRVAMQLKSPQRIALSGTPMPHSPLDIYAQYRALDKSIFGKSFVSFRRRYAVMGGFEQRQVIGYKDLPDLQRRAATIMYSMPKSLLTLPPIVESTLPVRLGPTAARAHAEMKKYLRTRIVSGEITAANGLVKLLRLQQITSGYLPDENGSLRCIGNEKHDALVEQLDSMPRDARVVVFSRFTHDVRQIIDAAREDHRHAFELSGEKDEREAWKQSKDGVLAVQIQAGGTGIDDLAPNAHFCVFYSVGYSLSDFIQAHERLHRPGQTETTTFIHLVAMGTIDEVVAEALAKREDLVNAVLEGIRKGT